MTPTDPIVHCLHGGETICVHPAVSRIIPRYWPKPHLWVGLPDRRAVTCQLCIDVLTIWAENNYRGNPPRRPVDATDDDTDGRHVMIPVAAVEFHEGGNTIWVHSTLGPTVLRIKTMGRIHVSPSCENVVAHADILVKDDITVCILEEQ